MKYFVLITLLLFSCARIFGQTPLINFHAAYGGSAYDEVVDMIFNSNGNLVLFGSTRSSDYDLTLSQPVLSDFWLFELNDEGDIIFNKTFGGSGVDIGLKVFQDENDGYFLVGETSSPEITGGETITRTSVHYLNQANEFEWVYTYSCSSCLSNRPVDAQILPTGNIAILISENFSQNVANTLICLDPMGNFLWESAADTGFGPNAEMSLLFVFNEELGVSGKRASTIGNWGAHCQSRFSFDGDLIEGHEYISSFFTQDSEYPGAMVANEFGEMIIASKHNFYGGLDCYADQAFSMIPIDGNTLALSTYDESRTILDTHFINCDWEFFPSEIFPTVDNGYIVIGVGRHDGNGNNCSLPAAYSGDTDVYIVKYRHDKLIQNVFHLGGSGKDGYSGSQANRFTGDHVTGVLNGDGCLLLSITSNSNDLDMVIENGPYGGYDVHLFSLDCSNWFEQDCSACGLTFVENSDGQDQVGNNCTDLEACNYNPNAIEDDGSCVYGNFPYDCNGNCLNDADENGICDEFEQSAPFNLDYNGDGIIDVLDMLQAISLFGQPVETVPCISPE